MKKALHNTLLFCCLLIINLVISQQKNDSVIGSALLLFPEFTDGIVTFKDGSQYSAKFNYDTYSDQMQFLDKNNLKIAFAEPQKELMIEITDRKFYYINKHFVELIYDDLVPLYVRVHQEVIGDKNVDFGYGSSGSRIQTVSSVYIRNGTAIRTSELDEDLLFLKTYFFYVTNKGKTRTVLNKMELLKCFSSKKGLILNQLEKQKTNFNSIESVRKIIEWINVNGIKD